MSEFKKAVLKVVSLIPKGRIASYGQIALLAGVPRGARQVGNILCQHGEGNTPWWRVINNAGRITTTCGSHCFKTKSTAGYHRQPLHSNQLIRTKLLRRQMAGSRGLISLLVSTLRGRTFRLMGPSFLPEK